MKQFRVKLKKAGSGFMIRLPKLISDRFRFKDGDEIEISILATNPIEQGNLWESPPEEITQVSVHISKETHSLNMYNRIYIPVKLRFFYPPSGVDFILRTNAGTISTNITSDGFIKKNLISWFAINGPLDTGDHIDFLEEQGVPNQYRMDLQKHSTSKAANQLEKK